MTAGPVTRPLRDGNNVVFQGQFYDDGSGALVPVAPYGAATAAKQDALAALVAALATEAGMETALASILAKNEAIRALLAGALATLRLPLTYTTVGRFTLTSSWQKVATTTSATKGLRISPLAGAANFDIEWVSTPAGTYNGTSTFPPDVSGEPVFGGEDFAGGLPVGDIWLKSATAQVAIVKTGA